MKVLAKLAHDVT